MKPTTKNRLQKLIAAILVLVIFVMLLIPSELTSQQLAQVQPGMSLEHIKELIGDPCSERLDLGVVIPEPGGYRFTLKKKGKFWKPTVSASMTGMSLTSKSARWIGKTHLLWVEHENGIVTKTWLYPLTRTGGGLPGCIDSIKEYWNNWWK